MGENRLARYATSEVRRLYGNVDDSRFSQTSDTDRFSLTRGDN